MAKRLSALIIAALAAAVLTIIATASLGAPDASAQQRTSQPLQRLCVTNVPAWDTLNLRTGPGTNYPVRTEMPHNTCSLLLNGQPTSNGWFPIEYTDPSGTVYGWASSRFLRPANVPMPPPPPPTIPHIQFCVQAPNTLNLRTGPSTRYSIVAKVYNGDCTVTSLGPTNGPWTKVRWNGGYGSPVGWMHASYLRPNIPSPYPGPIVLPHPPIPVPPPFPVGPPLCVTGIGYGDSLNVRRGPGTHHSVITALPPGACVNVLGNWSPHSWTRVALRQPSGGYLTGYAYGKFLTPSAPTIW